MKNVLLTVSLMLAALSTSAFAEDKGGIILGVKTGKVSVDKTDFEDDDTGTAILLGYEFSNNFAIEFESGKADDFEAHSRALYLAYRSAGDLYFKVRGGHLKRESNSDQLGDDHGASYGIGGGYRFGALALEAEYTRIEKDIDFLSLGLNYKF